MQIIWPEKFGFVSKGQPDGVFVPSGAIATYAQSIAELLTAQNLEPGDRIALWLTDGSDKIAAVLGCWMAGVAFCVLPSFAGNTKTERSQNRIQGVFSVLEPKLLLQGSADPLSPETYGDIPSITLTGVPPSKPETPDIGSVIAARDAKDLAFIQFTSGSTGGKAKGAEVRFGQLEANLETLAQRTQLTGDDHMVSWAPLYHDMGLMAVLLALRAGADLTLMETDHFVRRPSAWLEAISKGRGTVTTAPPTALKLLTRRRAAEVDLSSLRYAWIGGEAVFPKVVEGFEDAYADAGLARGVIQPTYGMAETVVGISCGEPGVPWTTRKEVISCGKVLDGMEIEIQTADDEPLPDGTEGRIVTRGPSVIDGYLGLERFEKGAWYDTGDLGFQEDGFLFITGRAKDLLKRGAESYPATLVETVAEAALELRTGRVAAFAIFRADQGKEEIVLLVESRAWDDQQVRTVAAAVLSELGLQVDVIRPAKGGRLPRTSSGKLMREMTAKQYLEGTI
ncbi:AMP-binding protein [Rhodobacteraceae bacterium]|nr:AMP-binding protein [Paracoccaceae bacterium]